MWQSIFSRPTSDPVLEVSNRKAKKIIKEIVRDNFGLSKEEMSKVGSGENIPFDGVRNFINQKVDSAIGAEEIFSYKPERKSKTILVNRQDLKSYLFNLFLQNMSIKKEESIDVSGLDTEFLKSMEVGQQKVITKAWAHFQKIIQKEILDVGLTTDFIKLEFDNLIKRAGEIPWGTFIRMLVHAGVDESELKKKKNTTFVIHMYDQFLAMIKLYILEEKNKFLEERTEGEEYKEKSKN